MLEEAMEIRESQNANRQNQIKHITESVSGMHMCVYVCVCVCMYVCVRMWKIGIRERVNVYVCVRTWKARIRERMNVYVYVSIRWDWLHFRG